MNEAVLMKEQETMSRVIPVRSHAFYLVHIQTHQHTCTNPMEGGPKSLNAGLKLDDDGSDGDGTEEPGRRRDEVSTFYRHTGHTLTADTAERSFLLMTVSL